MSRSKRAALEEAEEFIIPTNKELTLLEQFNAPRRSAREKKAGTSSGEFLEYQDNDDDEAFLETLKEPAKKSHKKKIVAKDPLPSSHQLTSTEAAAMVDQPTMDSVVEEGGESSAMIPDETDDTPDKPSKRKTNEKEATKSKKKRKYTKKTDDDYAESDVEDANLSSTDDEFLASEKEVDDDDGLAVPQEPKGAVDKILGRKLMLPEELEEMKTAGMVVSEDEIEKYWYFIKWKGVSYLHVSWESVADLEKIDQSAKFKIRRFVNKRRGIMLEKKIEADGDISIEVDEFERDNVLGESGEDSREVEYYPAMYIDVSRIICCDQGQLSVYHACLILGLEYKSPVNPTEEAKDTKEVTEGEEAKEEVTESTPMKMPDFEHYCSEPPSNVDDHVLYLVKWQLLGYQESTWETYADIRTNNPDEIFKFWKRQVLPPDTLCIAAGALSTTGSVSIPIVNNSSSSSEAASKMIPLKRQISDEGVAFDINLMFARPPQSLHVGIKRSPVFGLTDAERMSVLSTVKDKLIDVNLLLVETCEVPAETQSDLPPPLDLQPPASADGADISVEEAADRELAQSLDQSLSDNAERRSNRQQTLRENRKVKEENEYLKKMKEDATAKERKKLRLAQRQLDIQEYHLDPQITLRMNENERNEAILYNLVMKRLEKTRSMPPNSPKASSIPDEIEDDAAEAALEKALFLRSYQVEGLNWLTWNWLMNRSCILADEMGLGKTIQALAFLQHLWKSPLSKIRGPFLVVAPLSLINQWYNEATLWTPDLNVVIYHGNVHGRQAVQDYEFRYQAPFVSEISARNLAKNGVMKVQVLLTTYEMVIKDTKSLSAIHWRCIIVDEAHRLKNSRSRLSQQLALLSRDHSVMMTGTPLQNRTEELWSLLHSADKNKFANQNSFMSQFGDLRDNDQVAKLHDVLRPYLLRRVKEDVEKSLPPKEETLIEVSLTMKQKQFYRAIYEKNTTFLFKGAKASNVPSLMNIMMELRKCCNHPYLIRGVEDRVLMDVKEGSASLDREGNMRLMINCSGKLVLLDKLLPKLKDEGHKVLIFSQMVRVLDILEQYVRYKGYVYERLDGSYHALERSASVERFNKPTLQRFVMLLSTRAGGLGLNLTAADTVIIYDSDWNPHNDIQAQARAHRIGQTRNVMVYRLLTSRTYEMHMFHQASMKLGLDRAVLAHTRSHAQNDDDTAPKFDFKASEIDELLKKGAYDVFKSDDSETQAFVEADIDQILKGSARRIMFGEGSRAGSSSFSKASFVTRDNEEYDIAIDDPDFWEKSIGLKPPVLPNIEEMLMNVPLQRTRKNVFANAEEVVGYEALQRMEEELSDDESSVNGYEEEDEEASKQKKPAVNRPRLKTGSSKPWGLHARDRLVKCLTTYGLGRWKRIQRDLCALSLASEPVDEDEATKNADVEGAETGKLATFIRPQGVPFQPIFRSVEEIKLMSFYFLMQCGMLLIEQERFEIENPPEEAEEAAEAKDDGIPQDPMAIPVKPTRTRRPCMTPLQEVSDSPFMKKVMESSRVFEDEFNNKREEFEIDAEIADVEHPKAKRGRKKKKWPVKRKRPDDEDDDEASNHEMKDADAEGEDVKEETADEQPKKRKRKKKKMPLVFSYDDSEADEDIEDAPKKRSRAKEKPALNDNDTESELGDEENDEGDGTEAASSSHRKTQRQVPEDFFPSALLDDKFLARLKTSSCSGVVKILQKVEMMLKLQEIVHEGCSSVSVCGVERSDSSQSSSSAETNMDDLLELASKDQFNLILRSLPIGDVKPSFTRISPWWDDNCDRNFLLGVFIHGQGKYEDIVKDTARFSIFTQKIESFKASRPDIVVPAVLLSLKKDVKAKPGKKTAGSQSSQSIEDQFDFKFIAELSPNKLVTVQFRKKTESQYYGVYSQSGSLNWISVYCPPLLGVDKVSSVAIFLGSFERIEDAAAAHDIEVRNRQEDGDEGADNVPLNFDEDGERHDLSQFIASRPPLEEIESYFDDEKAEIPWRKSSYYKSVRTDGLSWYSDVKLFGKTIHLGPFTTDLQSAIVHDVNLRLQTASQADLCFPVGIEVSLRIMERNSLISCKWEDPTAMPKVVKGLAEDDSRKTEGTVAQDKESAPAKTRNPRKKSDMPDVRSQNRLITWLVSNESARHIKSKDPPAIVEEKGGQGRGRGKGRKKKRDGYDESANYVSLNISQAALDLTKELVEGFILFYLRKSVNPMLTNEVFGEI